MLGEAGSCWVGKLAKGLLESSTRLQIVCKILWLLLHLKIRWNATRCLLFCQKNPTRFLIHLHDLESCLLKITRPTNRFDYSTCIAWSGVSNLPPGMPMYSSSCKLPLHTSLEVSINLCDGKTLHKTDGSATIAHKWNNVYLQHPCNRNVPKCFPSII